jgi:hypothetical protein
MIACFRQQRLLIGGAHRRDIVILARTQARQIFLRGGTRIEHQRQLLRLARQFTESEFVNDFETPARIN